MTSPIFAIRDQMVGFLEPFSAVNENVAKRDFTNAVNNASGRVHLNPDNYDLYHIADYDTESGVIKPCEPELILTGLSVFKGE